MSITRPLPLPRLARIAREASRAALLGLAFAALVGTTGCTTCCRRCPPPCCGDAQPMPMPPPMPPPLPPAPKPPGTEMAIAAAKAEAPTIEACRPFLSPPGTKSMPDVVMKGTNALDPSQLDKGGFVLWQIQNGSWQHVGWTFKLPNSDMEHWVYKPNFAAARCAAPLDTGAAWTLSFQCANPGIQDLDDFFAMVRSMNGGSFLGLTYRTHAMGPGVFPSP